MGTRSDIIVRRADGKWARIYCHWDGYLENNGKILFEHYSGQKIVEKLIALGDLSSLKPKIGVKHPFDAPRYDQTEARAAYNKKYGDMCLAYGRDRGKGDADAQIGDTLFDVMPPEDTWTEFTYVWCANPTVTEDQPTEQAKWWVGIPGEGTQNFIDLGDALLGKKTLSAPVKAFGMIIGQHDTAKPGKDHSWKQTR